MKDAFDVEKGMETVDQCPLCGCEEKHRVYRGTLERGAEKVFSVQDYSCTGAGLAKYSDIVACDQCGVLYLKTKPSEEMLNRLYSDVIDAVYLEEEEGRRKTFKGLVSDLNSLPGQRGRLFEVGAYTGLFLELARRSGWEVHGLELSRWGRKVAKERRGLDLLTSLDELTRFPQGYFEAVVMLDVIEHLSDPGDMIDSISRVLKKGGILVLSTIMLDSLSARVLGSKYPFLMLMHLVYFNKKTMSDFLERHGFDVIYFKKHRRYVSFKYLFEKVGFLSKIMGGSAIGRFLAKQYFVSSVGIRDVYARKTR